LAPKNFSFSARLFGSLSLARIYMPEVKSPVFLIAEVCLTSEICWPAAPFLFAKLKGFRSLFIFALGLFHVFILFTFYRRPEGGR